MFKFINPLDKFPLENVKLEISMAVVRSCLSSTFLAQERISFQALKSKQVTRYFVIVIFALNKTNYPKTYMKKAQEEIFSLHHQLQP